MTDSTSEERMERVREGERQVDALHAEQKVLVICKIGFGPLNLRVLIPMRYRDIFQRQSTVFYHLYIRQCRATFNACRPSLSLAFGGVCYKEVRSWTRNINCKNVLEHAHGTLYGSCQSAVNNVRTYFYIIFFILARILSSVVCI